MNARDELEPHRAAECFFRSTGLKTFVVRLNEDGIRSVFSCKPSKRCLIDANKDKLVANKQPALDAAIQDANVADDASEIWIQEFYKDKDCVRMTVLFWRNPTKREWVVDKDHPLIVPHNQLASHTMHNFIILDPNSPTVSYYSTNLKKKQRTPSVSTYAIVGKAVVYKTKSFNATTIMTREHQEFTVDDGDLPLYRHYVELVESVGTLEEELEDVNALWDEEKKTRVTQQGKKYIWEKKTPRVVFLVAGHDSVYRRNSMPVLMRVVGYIPCEGPLYAMMEKLGNEDNWLDTKPNYMTVAAGEMEQVRWLKQREWRTVSLNKPIPWTNPLIWIDLDTVVSKGDLDRLSHPAFIAGPNECKILNIPAEELRDRVLHQYVHKEAVFTKRKRLNSQPIDVQSRFSELYDEDSWDASAKRVKKDE